MNDRLLPAALAFALVAGCASAAGEEPASAAAVRVSPADVHAVRRVALQTGPHVSGSLDARRRADVRAETGGTVLQVEAEIGQEVGEQQLLARIDAHGQEGAVPSARAALIAARQQLRVSRRHARRTKALVKAGALARRDLELARSAVSSAAAQFAQARVLMAGARAQLARSIIRAPMEGVVSEVPVHAGDVVAPGAPLFTIIDPTTMYLEASVPAEDLHAVKVGARVTFQVRGYPDRAFRGEVQRISPAADRRTRQIAILVGIPNESGALVAGLFADGRVTAATREGLAVPVLAVDTSGEQPVVTRVTGGLVERVTVQLGLEDRAAARVEVVSGLLEGDIVLLGSARGLPPGTRVVAAPAAPPPSAPFPEAGPAR